jgi:hypothetical protein
MTAPPRMASRFEVSLFLNPLEDLTQTNLEGLHSEIQQLGALCFTQTPHYQVFLPTVKAAFANKHLVLLRHEQNLVAFVSAIPLRIEGILQPVIHTGLVVIHPQYRRSNAILQHLYGNLFVAILMEHPAGFWVTSLAEVVSSLVNVAIYAKDVFPSPYMQFPSQTHLRIAEMVNARYRGSMLVSPDAAFDRARFVFRGSNAHSRGRMFMKDVDNRQYWHRDEKLSQYYRSFLRQGAGDEVLQVGFLDINHLRKAADAGKHGQRMEYLTSKL